MFFLRHLYIMYNVQLLHFNIIDDVNACIIAHSIKHSCTKALSTPTVYSIYVYMAGLQKWMKTFLHISVIKNLIKQQQQKHDSFDLIDGYFVFYEFTNWKKKV